MVIATKSFIVMLFRSADATMEMGASGMGDISKSSGPGDVG
jgi:hypothetical protein